MHQALKPAQKLPWLLLVEAGLIITVASLGIRLASLRNLATGSPHLRSAEPSADIETIGLVVRAVQAWARRLPWRTLCFEQGLCAHWMLRRRGIESTLCYGAATIDGQLTAHVWVRSGNIDVIGCENAADYALLAEFPARNP